MTTAADDDEARDNDPQDGTGSPDEVMSRGIEMFQAAAVEAIGAARAMLDVAEDLIHDPNAAARVIETLGSVTQGVSRFTNRPESATSEKRAERRPDDEGEDGGIRRIPVT